MLLGHSWWPKVKCWPVTPLRSSEVTEITNSFFADNLRLRRARDMKVVSMCLSRHYASTDMQLGSRRDLDLRSNFDLDLSRSCYACSMRHDGANTMVSKSLLYHFKHRSYHWKTVSLKNAVFDLSWPLTLKRLILVEIWRHQSEERSKSYLLLFWIWRSYYSSGDNGRHSW